MHPWNPNMKSTGRPGDWTPPLRQTVPVGAHCVSAYWATEAGTATYHFTLKLQAVAEITANNFRGLLFFTAPGMYVTSPNVNINNRSNRGSVDIRLSDGHISLSHRTADDICFVVWPTRIKYKIIEIFHSQSCLQQGTIRRDQTLINFKTLNQYVTD